MGQVLINLQVPAVNVNYDLFAPDEAAIKDIVPLLAKGVSDMSNGNYCISGMEQLASREPDRLLNPRKSLADYGISDGSVLMLL